MVLSLCQELYIKIKWMFLTLIVSKDTFLMFFLFFTIKWILAYLLSKTFENISLMLVCYYQIPDQYVQYHALQHCGHSAKRFWRWWRWDQRGRGVQTGRRHAGEAATGLRTARGKQSVLLNQNYLNFHPLFEFHTYSCLSLRCTLYFLKTQHKYAVWIY